MDRTTLKDIISCAALPTLPTIAVQLLELTGNPNVELNKISRLVESDPGLAARILRTVNSSLYGLRTPCTSIQRALTFLGLNAVKSLVLGFSLVEMTADLDEKGEFDFQSFWRRSVFGAVASRQVATLAGVCDPDEAFTCGMFQNMGVLASYVALGVPYLDLVASSRNDPEVLAAAEQEHFGFTHLQAGAALSEKWKFPPILVGCLRHLSAPESAPDESGNMARVVALGRITAELLSSDDATDRIVRMQGLAAHWFGEEFEDLNQLLKAVTKSAAELAGVLDKDIGQAPDLDTIRRCAEQQSLELQLAIQREIEDLRRQRQELTSAVFTDGLTGVWNRKRFDEDLRSAFEYSRETHSPFAIFFFDADRFKSLNDQHGHQIGDAVLIELSRRLHETVGALGSVYRYGGEEFTVIIEGWDLIRAVQFGELIRSVIETQPFDVSKLDASIGELNVTVSVGASACVFDENGKTTVSDAWDVVRAADDAMYDAKHSGRNCLRTKAAKALTVEDAAKQRASGAATGSSRAPLKPPTDPLVTSADLGRITRTNCPSDESELSRVLLVESDALAAALLGAVFAQHKGIKLRRVDDSPSAISCLTATSGPKSFAPHVILCDHALRNGSAMEIIEFVRRHESSMGIPIVIMSTCPSDELRRQYEQVGVPDVFSKEYMSTHMSKWMNEFKTRWLSHALDDARSAAA